MPQTFDYMGARRAGYSVKEIQQATKDIDIQNALEQWGEKFVQKQARQREAVNAMMESSRSRASAGLTPAETLYPAGVTRDPIGQDIQNMAAAPNVPRPTGIVRAENVAPDLVSAFEQAPESSLGDATSGYLSEAPNVKLRGARGIVQGIKDAPKAGWLGLNQAASAGMQAIGDVIQEDIGILTKAAKATSDLLTLNMSPTEIPADTGSNVIQRVGRDAYAAHTQGMQELADKYAPDSWGGAVMNAGAQTGQQLGILGTAAAIGIRNPAAMTKFSLGALGAQSGLTEYGDARAKGFDVPRSMLKAGVGGGMEVVTEVAPMGKLVNFMSTPAKKGVAAFLKDAAEYGLQDIGGELLNTMITDVVNNKMQARPNMTPQEQADEVSRYFSSGEWKQAAATTFKQALLQSGIMLGSAKGVQHLDAKIRGEQSPLTDGVTFQPQDLPPVNPERQGRVDKLAGIMANESERTAQMRLNIANQRRSQQPAPALPAQQVVPDAAQPAATTVDPAQQQTDSAPIAPTAEAPAAPVVAPEPTVTAPEQTEEAIAPELADLLRRKTNLEKAIFAADGTEKKTATKRMKDNYAAVTATITALQQQNPEQEVSANGQQAELETATAEPGAVATDAAGGTGGAAQADEASMGSAEAMPDGAVSGVDEQPGNGMPVLRPQPDVAEAPQATPDIMALVDGKTDDQVQKTIDMVRGLNPERAGQIEAYWKSKATPVSEPQAEQESTPAAQDGQESVPPAGDATQKQPWEMTREEWKTGDHSTQRSGKNIYYVRPDKTRTLWAGTTSKQKAIESQHRFEIQRAMQDGRTISAEVLKDYPDLNQKVDDANGAKETGSTATPSAVSGRSLFTTDQLAEFDKRGIDVSGVTAQYKNEALQQLGFQQEQENKLASPDYDANVQAEYDRIKEAQKEDKPQKNDTYTPETHKTLFKRLRDGDSIDVASVKQSYSSLLANEDSVKAELNALKKDDLLKRMGRMDAYRYKGEKKATVVNALYRDMLSDYAYLDASDSLSFSMGEKFSDVVQRKVDALTPEHLKKYAAKVEKQREAAKERMDGLVKSLKNPETWEEFQNFITMHKDKGGIDALTPEQRKRYDELHAEHNKEAAAKQVERKATVREAGEQVDSEIVETTHTKTGDPLFVVKAAERVDKDVYKEWNATAKKLGGWYSSYRAGGAVPGFQFKTRESAESFRQYLKGDAGAASETIKERIEERQESKKQSAADKLAALADSMEEKANGVLNADRLTNTAKRAQQAESTDASARKTIALATTIRNIARAIQAGEAKHLEGISAGTHVETLDAVLSAAKYANLRENGGASWSVTDERHRAPNESDMDYVEYPYPNPHQDHIKEIGLVLREKSGAAKDGEWLMKRYAVTSGNNSSVITFTSPSDIERLESALAKAKKVPRLKSAVENVTERMAKYKRLQKMGIPDVPTLRAALREYLQFKDEGPKADKAKQLERQLAGNKNVGIDFFPTPPAVAADLVERAGIEPGMKVLEPSGGTGNIAEAIREAGAEVDVAEISGQMRELLEAKGFNLVAHDFMDLDEGSYDAVVMNPPFSADIEHVRHAFDLLKPGGRLVAIVGEGSFGNQKKHAEFQEWLDEHGATVEKLPQGTFTDRTQLKTTGANARVVEVVKRGQAEVAPTFSKLTPAGKRGSAQAYTVHLSPSQAMSLKEIRQEVSDGEAGGRAGIYNESAPGTTQVSWGGSFPEYFQNRGLTKKQVLPILDRIIRGESVTEAQWLVAEGMLKAKRYDTLNRVLNERAERQAESHVGMSQEELDAAKDDALDFFSQFGDENETSEETTGSVRTDEREGAGRGDTSPVDTDRGPAPAADTIDESGWGQQVAAELQGDKKQVRFGDKKQTGRNVGLSEFMDEFTPDPQKGLFGESVTLDSMGLQQIYERLASTKLVKDAMADLKRLGGHVYAQGNTAWKAWFSGMKDSLGKLFRRFRPTMEKLWQAVNNERGSITLRTDRTGDPRVDAVLDKIGSPDKTLADRIKDSLGNLAHKETRMREIEQGFFDRYASLRYLDKMAGITGPDDSAYISARMSTSFSDVMYAMVHHGHPIWKDGGSAVQGKGLMEIFKPVADELDVFMGWMVGARAQKLMNEGRERYFDQDEINILKGLKTPENSARWEKVRRDYMQYKKQVLDFAEQAGVINPEARKIWDHEEYVPFYRVVEDKPKGPFKVKGLASQNSGIRTLKGADERLGDIFENIIQNFSHLTDAAIKNRATELAVQKAEQIGAATPAPLEWKAVKIGNQQVVDAVHEFFGETQDDIDAFVNPEEMEAFTTFFHPAKPMGKDVIHVLRDGKPQYYQVHDDLLLRSMTSINEQIWGGPAMATMRFVKRLLTIGVTSDPTFMLRNFIRDTLHTWTISRGDFTPVISSLTGAIKAFREDDDMVQLMAAGGAFHGGFAYGNDPAAVKLMVRKLITKKGIDRNTILDSVKKVWEAYQEIGSALENAARVQTYANVKAKTGSHLQAAFDAKDIMDFSVRGDWAAINFLTQTVPFLGARIQGLQRLGKGAMENPVAFTLKGTAIALASTLLWLHNRLRPEYQELEEWDKDTYFHFFVGKKHFRLPKPFEVGAIFGTIPERLMELTLEKQHDGWLFVERMIAILTQTFAVGLPQILNEPMQQWANKDFFTGREIVGRDLQRLLPGEQSNPYTSATAKELGRAVHMSPRRLEHAVKGYFGALGMYCMGASDMLVRKLWDYPSEPATKPEDWPVLSAFYRGEGPARNTKYTTEFYELLREADQLTDTVQRLRETGEVPRADKLIEKNLPKLAAGGILGQAQSELSKINKQMKIVHLNRTMSPDEKRAQLVELQRIKNEITRGVVGQAKVERNQ